MLFFRLCRHWGQLPVHVPFGIKRSCSMYLRTCLRSHRPGVFLERLTVAPGHLRCTGSLDPNQRTRRRVCLAYGAFEIHTPNGVRLAAWLLDGDVVAFRVRGIVLKRRVPVRDKMSKALSSSTNRTS